MTCRNAEPYLLEYVAGTLSEGAVRAHIATCATCQEAAQTLQETRALLHHQLPLQPAPEMRQAFYAMLTEEKQNLEASQQRTSGWWQSWRRWGLAAAFVSVFVIGYGVAVWLPSDTPQSDLTTLLKSSSPADRLAGVYVAWEAPQEPTTAAALLDLLDTETNVNVQAAALEVLQQYEAQDRVAVAVMPYLTPETDPIVQVILLRFLAEHRPSGSQRVVQTLLAAPSLESLVRQEAERVLNHLTI